MPIIKKIVKNLITKKKKIKKSKNLRKKYIYIFTVPLHTTSPSVGAQKRSLLHRTSFISQLCAENGQFLENFTKKQCFFIFLERLKNLGF